MIFNTKSTTSKYIKTKKTSSLKNIADRYLWQREKIPHCINQHKRTELTYIDSLYLPLLYDTQIQQALAGNSSE